MRVMAVGGVAVLASLLVAAQYPRFDNIAATENLQVCGSTIQVNFVAGDLDLPHADVLQWVRNAGESVAKYYGRFPVKTETVYVTPRADRDGVLNGTTWGGHTVRTRMGLGQHTTVAELNDDWTMTHEFVHTAFPDLEESHHWIEE